MAFLCVEDYSVKGCRHLWYRFLSKLKKNGKREKMRHNKNHNINVTKITVESKFLWPVLTSFLAKDCLVVFLEYILPCSFSETTATFNVIPLICRGTKFGLLTFPVSRVRRMILWHVWDLNTCETSKKEKKSHVSVQKISKHLISTNYYLAKLGCWVWWLNPRNSLLNWREKRENIFFATLPSFFKYILELSPWPINYVLVHLQDW